MKTGLTKNGSICHDSSKIVSDGIWHDGNPLLFSLPLLLVQLSIISLTSIFFEFCLRPLGQPSIVAHVIAGVVLGPTVLGLAPKVASQLFPPASRLTMETFATFGLTLFLFSMGVKMDASLLIKPEKIAISIALSMYLFTIIIPVTICFYLIHHAPMEEGLRRSLPLMVGSQSFTAFPAIACLLAELKIMNTEVGRLAVATSMFYFLLGMTTCAIGFTFLETTEKGAATGLSSAASSIGLALVIFCVFRPILRRFLLSEKASTIDPSISSGTTMAESSSTVNGDQVAYMFVLILICTFVSEVIGQHYFLGPLLLGLAIPDGSTVGAAVVSRIDAFVSFVLYPTFLTITGLKTNLFSVTLRESWITGVIVVVGVVAKIVTIVIPALHENVPLHDAFVLSLVLNARGINELLIYNLVYDNHQMDDQEFAMMVMSVVLVTAVISPLIKMLYNPTKRCLPTRRMTIQHAKKNTEIKIVVCIHQDQQDNIPTMVNLLEASCASLNNPIAVIVVILAQVVGHSAPMLLAYRPHQTYDASNSRGGQISNAFLHYERQNKGHVSVQVFTNKSHIDGMHDDICRVAYDKRATLLIIPFHKQWAVDGSIGAVNKSIQAMNKKIIDRASCSLGILIDRGPIHAGTQSILNGQSFYGVAVLFFGGPDDVESLAYGSRMARHEQVVVTVIRFLLLGHDNFRERKHHSDIVEVYRRANAGNQRFLYCEELVKDGIGLSEVIRGMGDRYDLIMVGRSPNNSQLLFGLHDWSECPELGAIGDLLASPDAGIMASVLVIQQQQKPLGKADPAFCMMLNNRRENDMVHDDSFFGRTSSARLSLAISLDDGR